MIGWILLAALAATAATTAIVAFWDNIKEWLNNTAADAVERYLGYGARQRMYRAVAHIDKVMNVIRNRTIVYTKKNFLDTYYTKTTMEATEDAYEIDSEVLDEINKEKVLEQTFEYKQ